MTLSQQEYQTEIDSMAAEIRKEAVQQVRDGESTPDISDMIYEAVDQHQWVIYTRYHFSVLEHSDHAEYGIQEGLIDASESAKSGNLFMHLAYWAMYADLYDELSGFDPEEELCPECGSADLTSAGVCESCGAKQNPK